MIAALQDMRQRRTIKMEKKKEEDWKRAFANGYQEVAISDPLHYFDRSVAHLKAGKDFGEDGDMQDIM